jgi:hypothetical protein
VRSSAQSPPDANNAGHRIDVGPLQHRSTSRRATASY